MMPGTLRASESSTLCRLAAPNGQRTNRAKTEFGRSMSLEYFALPVIFAIPSSLDVLSFID